MNVDMRLRGTKGMDGGPDKKGNAAEYGEGHVLSTVCVCTMRKDRTQQNSFPMLGITPRAFLMPGSICCQAIPSPALYFASNSSSSLEYCLEAKVTEGREKGKMALEWCEHIMYHFQALCLTGAQSLGHCHVHTSIPWGLLGELVHRILVSIPCQQLRGHLTGRVQEADLSSFWEWGFLGGTPLLPAGHAGGKGMESVHG